jgi:hypothetical protein
MATDRLIDELAAGLVPVRRQSLRRDAAILGGIGAAELTLFLLSGQARPDMHAAMALPSFWWKLASLGLLSLVGAISALAAFDPARSPRRGLRLLALIAIAALVVGVLIDTGPTGLEALGARLEWRQGIGCLLTMLVLALPPLVAFGLMMRRAAPTDRPATAMAAGAAGAAWGAFIFMFACPHDDPFYIAVWYGSGCVLMAIAGRLLLPRLCRW